MSAKKRSKQIEESIGRMATTLDRLHADIDSMKARGEMDGAAAARMQSHVDTMVATFESLEQQLNRAREDERKADSAAEAA